MIDGMDKKKQNLYGSTHFASKWISIFALDSPLDCSVLIAIVAQSRRSQRAGKQCKRYNAYHIATPHEEHDAMAVPEQVERLKRSVEEWNAWRQEQPDIHRYSGTNRFWESLFGRVDLSFADLSHTNLGGANLSYTYLNGTNLSTTNISYANLSNANLDGANLRDTNFTGANFSNASLVGADLSENSIKGVYLNSTLRRSGRIAGVLNLDEVRRILTSPVFHPSKANFSGANLSGADLRNANLAEADFCNSDLMETNLSGADLRNADLDKAHLRQTIFAENDLSTVRGLDTVNHGGPSFVDIKTVVLPQGNILKHFLRGVGFSDTAIEYLPSILTPTIQYYSLFLSHSHHDQAIAKRLYNDLQNQGVRCWFAPHDLRPGTPIVRGIEEAIHLHEKLLLILSDHAVNSPWVQQEVEAALYKEVTTDQEILFPIRLDNTVLESATLWAKRLRQRHIGDFTGWQDDTTYGQAFSTLLRHLKVAEPPTASL